MRTKLAWRSVALATLALTGRGRDTVIAAIPRLGCQEATALSGGWVVA